MLKNILRRIKNMFTLTKDSGLTKVWVSLVVGGTYTYDQVPNIFNLKVAVGEVLEEMGFVETK